MAEQPIKGNEIIEDGLFVDAIKQADLLIEKLKGLETQQVANLTASKEFINSFKGDGSKSLKDLNTETIKVNATLKEYEVTQLGIADIAKKTAQLKEANAKATREELKLAKDLLKADAEKLKITTAQNGEYSKASKELSRLKRELQDLNIAGKTNTKEFKELNKQFEELDTRVRKADASVGNFQRNVGNYPAQLKAMQRELQGLEPGSKAFNDLAEKAGKLKDAIGDAKDATKAFATESKATTAKTLFGQIGNDIADLDFKGAAEKAGQFAGVMKSITFAEVVAGVKAFGSAIVDVGKSLLLNPFVAIAAAVAYAAYQVYDLVKSFTDLGVVSENTNAYIKKVGERLTELADRQAVAMIKLRIAKGEMSKEDGEIAMREFQNNKERKGRLKEYNDAVLKETIDYQTKKKEIEDSYMNKSLILADPIGGAAVVNTKLFNLKYTYLKNIKLLENETRRDLIATKKAQNDEDLAEDEANAAEKLRIAKEQKKKIVAVEKNKGGMSETLESKDVAIIEESEKELELKTSLVDKNTAGLVDNTKANNAKLEAERKAAQQKELNESIAFGKQMLDAVSKAEADKSAAKIAGYDKELKDADKNIDMQRQLAIKGSKNSLAEAEADKVRIELDKEKEKEREIKRQKALAFFKLFASYAEKDPNTALTKALRDTVLAEAVAGAFFTGTEKVEDDLKGAKRHSGIDGYRIDVDGSERIMTGEQNAKVGALSNEALADLAYKHNNGLLDTAKYGVIQTNGFATNLANSALLMETMALRKEMQEVKEAIKNKPVPSYEFTGQGDFIKTTIENGFKKVTTYKQNKPRI